jgi:hypothetical protein
MSFGQCRTVTIKDVQRSDRTGRRLVRGIPEFIFGNQLTDCLQIRTGKNQKTFRFENAKKFFQDPRYLVSMDVFDIVGGVDGIHTLVTHPRHVQHGTDNVGFVVRIDVKTDFLP